MTLKHVLATAITWLVAFLLIPLPLILVLNQNLIDTPSNILAIDFGLFAYVWWLIIVYLSTRPKWLAKIIGLPSMYFLHAFLGVIAIIAAFLHQNTIFSMHPIIKRTGLIAFYLALFLLIYAVIFLSGWLVDRLSFMRDLKEKSKHVLSHQVSLWLHRLNLLVIGLIFLHVHLIPRINRLNSFMLLFDSYTLIALAFYLYKKLIIDYNHNFGIVSRLQKLNEHTLAVFVTPNDKDKNYHAGDFYFLSFVNNKAVGKEKHPFSVASSPVNSKELVFQIDQVGDYTKRLSMLKAGDLVRLEGPFGLFDQEIKDYDGPIVLYGLGGGIAPLLGLAEQYQDKEVHLIWSQSRTTGSYYEEKLAQVRKKRIKINCQ